MTSHGARPRLDAFEAFLADPGDPEPERQAVQQYMALMQRCWAAEPAHRPRFKQVCAEVLLA